MSSCIGKVWSLVQVFLSPTLVTGLSLSLSHLTYTMASFNSLSITDGERENKSGVTTTLKSL